MVVLACVTFIPGFAEFSIFYRLWHTNSENGYHPTNIATSQN
jgi:hypothetical protein